MFRLLSKQRQQKKVKRTILKEKCRHGLPEFVQGEIFWVWQCNPTIPVFKREPRTLNIWRLACLSTVNSRLAWAIRFHLKTITSQKQNKKMFGFGGHIVSVPICSFVKCTRALSWGNKQAADQIFSGLYSLVLGLVWTWNTEIALGRIYFQWTILTEGTASLLRDIPI